ncbi:MAG: MOSC domain-containing protein [Actinomycetota bacterium]
MTDTPSIGIAGLYVGGPRPLGDDTLGITSAIHKRPVDADTSVALTELNLAGDDQADRTVHGGPDKAVYAHPDEHRSAWAADLDDATIDADRDAPAVGENVATLGADESTVRIGDVWQWGDAVLAVCQPRWPCQKLTVYRRSTKVGPLMRSSGRTGWYLRVLVPGTVPAAGPISVEPHPSAITVFDAHQAMLDRHTIDRALIERVVALGPVLADEWRLPLIERLGGR